MSQSIDYDGGTALEGVVRPATVRFVEAAHLGETGMGALTIDDVAGSISIIGLKDLVIEEGDATPVRSFTGSVADRHYRRGAVLPDVGASRETTVDIIDLNARLGFRAVTGDDGDRPAETVGERMTWVLASGYLALSDTGWVVYPETPMSAADYRGQSSGNVVSDCATTAGFNYFARWDPGSSQAGLGFFDGNTSTLLTSSKKISNVEADIDGSATFAPLDDAELTRSPEPIRSGMYVPYLRGAEYVTRPTTAAAFAERDGTAPSATVEDAAAAIALGQRLLLEASTEEDTITCTIWVEPEHKNSILAGDRLQVKFSHLPGYEGWTWVRVTQRAVSLPAVSRYQIDLTLSGLAASAPTAAAAAIFFSNDDNGYVGNNATVSWRKSGDSDPGSTTSDPFMGLAAPLSGALEYVEGAATPPFAGGGGWWNGIRCLAPGRLGVYFSTDISGLFQEEAPDTVRWQILLNGDVVAEYAEASQTSSCFAGICGWSPKPTVQTTIDVQPGDVITARVANFTEHFGSGRAIPNGVGQNPDCLVVSGVMYAAL